ncbi:MULTISPECIES: ABC transporter ATP-binding protein [Glutamicibacter]|uniref:Glutathione import ATP-binding protein GsiA n=1 Tax=Glutamicibacter creatinolyticus TaxID=162496 RepID=A0A5B7WTI1_9MICC|nr:MULTISPECIES: ABC transporter ATP-binding protein [Glutamicibacter]QCY46540.1 Glutathione import ATP-binding protein GsiA [Glutamicibacter creatinolyticus]TLK57115.1 ABC transporter ATP-binding protein [Glutamicibacter sp. V16R2B1]
MAETQTPQPLLEIKDLAITFSTPDGPVHAVRDANLTVMPGETVAIVGESGSGKSTTALSAIGLLPGNGKVSSGQILFDGEDIAQASEKRFVQLRGNQIGMVPQDPMSNLNPVWKIGFQVRETLKANGLAGKNPKERVSQVLADAGLPDPETRAGQYPHEFSGGMRQRALIAIGLACRPRLLIADEPTSALDVTVQQQILDHLDTMTSELGTAVLLITHDLGLAAERAEKVVVMYKGRVVESGPALELLRNPQHPYTKRLIAKAPSLASQRVDPSEGAGAKAKDELLKITDLTKVFDIRRGFGRKDKFTAVDKVSFSIPRGTTTAVVGESGSGKSTIAQMVLNLLEPTSGEIEFDGEKMGKLSEKELFKFRRRVQPIFQDPYGSLDPMFSIYRTIEEPLRIHGIGNSASRQKRVKELLDQVSMPASTMHRFPNELSGGQRQRIAIARALALQPEMIVCDEAVSALDVLVQAQVLELLDELQRELGLTYLFITHDLAVVRQIADHVCVMERGQIVEQGTADDIFNDAKTEYTRNLLGAIPGATLI